MEQVLIKDTSDRRVHVEAVPRQSGDRDYYIGLYVEALLDLAKRLVAEERAAAGVEPQPDKRSAA